MGPILTKTSPKHLRPHPLYARFCPSNSRQAALPEDSCLTKATVAAQTRWGSSTLTIAFKLLLKEALAEPANARFVLLDESAVPLYPAAAVYLQLMGETKSRVAACVVRRRSHKLAVQQFDTLTRSSASTRRHPLSNLHFALCKAPSSKGIGGDAWPLRTCTVFFACTLTDAMPITSMLLVCNARL